MVFNLKKNLQLNTKQIYLFIKKNRTIINNIKNNNFLK